MYLCMYLFVCVNVCIYVSVGAYVYVDKSVNACASFVCIDTKLFHSTLAGNKTSH